MTRRATTSAIAVRYSAEARTSEIGCAAAAAALAAAPTASGPPSEPTRLFSASGTSRIVGASAVIATPALSTAPSRRVTAAVAPTTAISICRRYSRRA